MKFKPIMGAQLSGSLAGITASHNKGGTYFRQRSIPTNPSSFRQLQVRNAMSQLAAAWVSTLTPAERAAWETYAENVPLIDKIGDPITVGGLPMYQRSNVPRLQAGLTRVDAAPTIFDLGDFTTPTVSASAGSQEVTVDFDAGDPWDDEDDSSMLVYLSTERNPTINFFKGPYRLLATIDGNSVTPPTDPAVIPVTQSLTQGNKVFFQLRVSRADGRLSSAQRLEATIGA